MIRLVALLGMLMALIAGKASAQTRAEPQFQLPGLVGEGNSVRPGAKHRLLQFIRDRKWKEAARLADGLALSGAEDPHLHYLVGVVCWQRQDKIGAIQRFRSAEHLGLHEAYLHKALGLAYYDAHQYLLFEQQMARAIAADRADPEPHFYLGRHKESVQGDFAGALRHFKKVVALDPNHVRGHSYLAYCLERLDRREDALEHYRVSVELVKQKGLRFSMPYQGMARLALEGNPATAANWAREAVENEPDEFEAHALLARAHDRNGDLMQAVAAASEAVRLNPDHTASHYLLFTAHRKLGDSNEARRHVMRFQELKRIYGDQ